MTDDLRELIEQRHEREVLEQAEIEFWVEFHRVSVRYFASWALLIAAALALLIAEVVKHV